MALSYNGWLASPDPVEFGGLEALVVAGESFSPGVRTGDVHDVLQWLAEQLHARVEPVIAAGWHEADDWGFSYRQNRNAANLSCHSSGTAIDYNATRHPNGARGTFTKAQVAEIKQILAELNGVVRWGGDFTGTPDEMHFEIVGNAKRVGLVAANLRANPGTPPTSEEDDFMSALSPERQVEVAAKIDTIHRLLTDDTPGKDRLGDVYRAVESVGKDAAWVKSGVDRLVGAVNPGVDGGGPNSFSWVVGQILTALAQQGGGVVSAEDIAAAIPPDIAEQVAANLAARLAS